MSIDTKALIAATPATVALVRRELDKSRESQRGGMQCSIPKAVKVDCALVERLCRIAEKQADRLAALQSLCAQVYQAAGAFGMPERVLDVLSDAANGDPIRHANILPVDPPAHEARIAKLEQDNARLRGLLAAAQAEARELRALVTEFANFTRDSGWLYVADELEQRLAAIASQPAEQPTDCGNCHEGTTEFGHRCPQCEGAGKQPAERESQPLTFTQGVLCSLSILDRYGDSTAYREVADPHDLNQLWEEADEFDREHLARHGYRPTPAAQESGDA